MHEINSKYTHAFVINYDIRQSTWVMNGLVENSRGFYSIRSGQNKKRTSFIPVHYPNYISALYQLHVNTAEYKWNLVKNEILSEKHKYI